MTQLSAESRTGGFVTELRLGPIFSIPASGERRDWQTKCWRRSNNIELRAQLLHYCFFYQAIPTASSLTAIHE
jgi:hypothetical protein